MNRTLTWLNVALVGAALVVGTLLWHARIERAVWQQRAATTAHIKPTPSVAPRTAGSSNAATTLLTAPAPTPQSIITSAIDADAIEDARIIQVHAKRQPRMNALHGYDLGCTALHLPPSTVAKVKEIVLAAWAKYEAPAKTNASLEEARATAKAVTQKMDEDLTALLGPATYDELEAYHRQDHFDWTIGTDMWDGGAPLSPDQLHALCLVIVQTKFEEPKHLFTLKPVQIADPTTGLSSQDEILLAHSSAFLTSAQQQILRQSLIDDNRYEAAMRDFATQQRQLWESAK